MSSDLPISAADLLRINRFIHESLELKRQPGAAAGHFLAGLQGLVQAEAPASILFAGCMAPADGVSFDYRGRLHLGPLSEDWIKTFDWRLCRGLSPVLDGMREKVMTVNSPGIVNVWTRPRLVEDIIWQKSPIFKTEILPLKITDQLFAWYQARTFAVTFILRGTEGKVFDDRSVSIVKTALQVLGDYPELKEIIRPENVQPQLSPQLIRVRNMLLCGLSPEEIRKRLKGPRGKFSENTVSSYRKLVYEKYGVSGDPKGLQLAFLRLGGSVDTILSRHLESDGEWP